jgi:outer membrane protein insertion porin family
MISGRGQAMRAIGGRARQGGKVALMALLIGTATVSVPNLTPSFAQVFAFSTVRVEGNERVDARTILNYAGIARGAEISAGALNDAAQRITNSGLFETVEVAPEGSTLVIRVKENPVVNIINFEGNKRLKDEQLATLIQSQSRRVFNAATAEADAALIADAYRAQGRMAATVEPRLIRREGNRVDLVFEITEGRVVEVERLSFVGNRAFSDRRLRQVLETKQAGLLRQFVQRDTFQAERVALDRQLLTDFYLSRGYLDFQILDATAEVARERDATFVTFTIREGQQYRIGATSTVSEIEGVDAAEFEAVQRIRAGEIYSPGLIENNITRMETLALRKGLTFVRVDPRITRNDRGQVVDVEFAIVRGERVFVERIDIEGNATTLDEVVRRQFRTVEGDPFNPREIRQSAERIRALGFFADAQVEAEPGSSPDQVVVNVDLEEQPTGSLSFGVSYGVNSGPGLNIGFSETNFLGRGQALSASISTGTESQDSSISFTEPAFLGRDLALSLGAYYRTTDQQSARYNTTNIGLTAGLGFPLSEQGRLSLRLRASQDEITDYGGTSALIAAEAARGALLTGALGYTYEFDNRVTGLNPRGGVLLRFGQDFAVLSPDTRYVQTNLLALAETRVLNEEVTLRAVFEGGVIASLGDDGTRVTERFFGNGKIRGFEFNGIGPREGTEALGGNAFAVARLEADFPLGLPEEYGITGGAFVDVGSVWSLDATNGAVVGEGFEPRAVVGLGLNWATPIGPLRFNFTHAVKKEVQDLEQTFDLTLSTRF